MIANYSRTVIENPSLSLQIAFVPLLEASSLTCGFSIAFHLSVVMKIPHDIDFLYNKTESGKIIPPNLLFS